MLVAAFAILAAHAGALDLNAVAARAGSVPAHWRDAVSGWLDLLEQVTAEWANEHELPLPISPQAVATLVASAFLGTEALI